MEVGRRSVVPHHTTPLIRTSLLIRAWLLIRASLLRTSLVAACLAVSAFASPVEVAAQISAADSSAVLLRTASEFERDGRWEIAEAIYMLIVERYGSTPAAVEAGARLRAAPSDRLARISRVELQVFSTLYGLWLGVAVPVAFGADSPEAYGAGLLIGGPVGLLTSRAALRARPLSEGQARAVSWGGIWGTWQGLGVSQLFNFGEDEFCDAFGCYPTGDDTEETFAAMIVGGLAGIATGAIIARGPVGSGTSSGAQGGSIWGSAYGAMVAGIIDEDNGDAVLTTALLAGNLGLLAGAALSRKYDLSRSRVRMINLGALVGGIGGLGLDLLIQPDDAEAAIAIPLVTSVAGLLIAAHSTRDSDRGGVRDMEPDAALGSAILGYADGRLRVGAPLPMPALIPMDDVHGRPTWTPGLSVEVFRAVF